MKKGIYGPRMSQLSKREGERGFRSVVGLLCVMDAIMALSPRSLSSNCACAWVVFGLVLGVGVWTCAGVISNMRREQGGEALRRGRRVPTTLFELSTSLLPRHCSGDHASEQAQGGGSESRYTRALVAPTLLLFLFANSS